MSAVGMPPKDGGDAAKRKQGEAEDGPLCWLTVFCLTPTGGYVVNIGENGGDAVLNIPCGVLVADIPGLPTVLRYTPGNQYPPCTAKQMYN